MADRVWPLAALRRVYSIRRCEVEARAGVGYRALQRLEGGNVAGLRVRDLVAIGHALGVAPASLIPGLEDPPARAGLIQERGAGRHQGRVKLRGT
jgi:transcriptional regulator with XRE-family HTH domain